MCVVEGATCSSPSCMKTILLANRVMIGNRALRIDPSTVVYAAGLSSCRGIEVEGELVRPVPGTCKGKNDCARVSMETASESTMVRMRVIEISTRHALQQVRQNPRDSVWYPPAQLTTWYQNLL